MFHFDWVSEGRMAHVLGVKISRYSIKPLNKLRFLIDTYSKHYRVVNCGSKKLFPLCIGEVRDMTMNGSLFPKKSFLSRSLAAK